MKCISNGHVFVVQYRLNVDFKSACVIFVAKTRRLILPVHVNQINQTHS